MVSANTLCKKLLNVKNAVVEGSDFYTDHNGVNHIRIHARPNVWHENDCPICHKRCKCYDRKNQQLRTWRALDWGIYFQCTDEEMRLGVDTNLVQGYRTKTR